MNTLLEEYKKVLIKFPIENTEYGNIEDYDMSREMHRLERLYLCEQDV